MSWVRVLLSQIASEDCQVIAPNSVEARNRPYLGLEQIASGTGQILSYESTSVEGKSNTFAFDERHVLYGKLRPYLNKVALPDQLGRCSTEIIPLRPIGVDRAFLAMLMRSSQVVNLAMAEKTGSRMPRADLNVLLASSFRIPSSIDEQGQIALQLQTKLAEADKARQAAQTQLADIALLRARTLQSIFSELGTAPRKTLGDNAPTMSGATPSRGNKAYWQPAEIPWVKTGEVAFAPIKATEEAISTKALAECSLALLPPKTVLIAMIGQGKTRGQSAILEIAATTNQNCFAILPNDTWEPEFLYHWTHASYQALRNLSADRGGSQSALNGAMLKTLQVPAPDKATQKHIIQRVNAALATIDAMEQACKASLKDIERLPQRILAQVFGEAAPISPVEASSS